MKDAADLFDILFLDVMMDSQRDEPVRKSVRARILLSLEPCLQFRNLGHDNGKAKIGSPKHSYGIQLRLHLTKTTEVQICMNVHGPRSSLPNAAGMSSENRPASHRVAESKNG